MFKPTFVKMEQIAQVVERWKETTEAQFSAKEALKRIKGILMPFWDIIYKK